jgi:hypothetical protein
MAKTVSIRRQWRVEINAKPGTRESLEARFGQIWDPSQMAADFEATSFLAPFALVRRKSDGATGSLEFQNDPRFYFNFIAHD